MSAAGGRNRGSDFYKSLGVPRGAGEAQIKSAYRKLAIQYHPDKTQGDPELEAKFKEISAAYAVLSDPQKRRQYDQLGDAAVDLEALDMEQMNFGTTLVAALFSKLGAPIPTAIPQKTLEMASTPSIKDEAQPISWGAVMQGKISTHGVQFYAGELSEAEASKGFRVYVNSASASKFKLLAFDEKGGLNASEDSATDKYLASGGTSASMHFCSFKALSVEASAQSFKLMLDDDDTPPVFRRLETLSASQYSPVRKGPLLFALQGDNFFRDVKYTIQFSLFNQEVEPEIQKCEEALSEKQSQLCKLEQEYWEARQKYEKIMAQIADETELVDTALLDRDSLYAQMAGDRGLMDGISNAKSKAEESRAKAKAKKDKQAERRGG